MKKLPYIEEEWSLASCTSNIKSQLLAVANRYVGDNLPTTFQVRTISSEQFKQGTDGAWNLDLSKKLGSGTDGYALVCGTLMSGIEKPVDITISCFAPVRFYLNQEQVFKSTFVDEINRNLCHSLEVRLKPGRNNITLVCRRTCAGFGCCLSLPQTTIVSPLPSSNGQAGWVWSDIIDTAACSTLDIAHLYDDGTIRWNPQAKGWDINGKTPQQRIFPEGSGYCIAWCKLSADRESSNPVLLLDSYGRNEIYVNGQLRLCCETGQYKLVVSAQKNADIQIKSYCEGSSYGVIVTADEGVLLPPATMSGADDVWVYAGCFEKEDEWRGEDFSSLQVMPRGRRWSLDKKGVYLRTFFEGSFGDRNWVSQGGSAFGRWDYPLGVTLFGLLKTSVNLDRNEMTDYVSQHIGSCAALYSSAVSDKKLNGFPAYCQNLVRMDCLDDCGSMGLAMLECYKIKPDERYLEIASRIREFIINRLPKLEDGTFYRPAGSQHAVSTIWADDLYMSTPFLRCLYDITGDQEALNMGASQFLHFAKYLFLYGPDVFSHVYDLDRKCATGIPWGRGNGWVLFSLSYFLDGLTGELENKEELMRLFLTLSRSYRKLQGEKGLWHQVLTDPSSYEEASCTAMFIFGFCKGIENGWYGKEAPLYLDAAKKAYQGLIRYCIDNNGSVYGVCKGSGFSFTKEYYKEELFWVTNDNHGIGIILLAGNEILKLEE